MAIPKCSIPVTIYLDEYLERINEAESMSRSENFPSENFGDKMYISPMNPMLPGVNGHYLLEVFSDENVIFSYVVQLPYFYQDLLNVSELEDFEMFSYSRNEFKTHTMRSFYSLKKGDRFDTPEEPFTIKISKDELTFSERWTVFSVDKKKFMQLLSLHKLEENEEEDFFYTESDF